MERAEKWAVRSLYEEINSRQQSKGGLKENRNSSGLHLRNASDARYEKVPVPLALNPKVT